MKKIFLAISFFTVQLISYSQNWLDSSKVFFAKWNSYAGDAFEEQQRFFLLRIPASFAYDSADAFASDLQSQFFEIYYEDALRSEGDDYLWKNGKVDLVKYAAMMKKEDFTKTDTSKLSNLKISGAIEHINGFSVLRISYNLSETNCGNKFDRKCILYLVPVKPHGTLYDYKEETIILLRFSFLPSTNNNFAGKISSEILKTISRY